MRRRIVFLAAGTALLAVVLLAIPLGALAARSYLRDERLELQQAAASAAATARGDVTTARIAPHARVDGKEIRLSVYDRSGRRVSGPGPVTADPVVRAAFGGQQTSSTTDNRIAVAAPVSDGDQIVAVVLLTTSLDAVHQRTVNAWLALAGMGVAAVVVAAVVARFVAIRLTRPVDRLTAVASQVGRGDLTARADPSGVTELDTLAGTLNDSVERIQSMIERERAFSAEVSHQLRTPLSGLRLELDHAQQSLGEMRSPSEHASAESLGEALNRALDQADRLDSTISDVISLARGLTTARHVALSTLLDAVEHRWRSAVAARTRPLRVYADSGLPDTIAISDAAASQILDVLVDNAVVHGSGAVSVHAHDLGQAIAIDVSDEGPELTAEAHELFGARDRPSHGIGLRFARRLAEAEGGRLVVAAAQPPTFRLVVPNAT